MSIVEYNHRMKGITMNLAEILKILGDESRLRIINLLLEQRLCVCGIEKILGTTQSNTSRHLNKLKIAGVLSATKKSQWIYYSMNEKFLQQNEKLIEFLKEKFSQQEIFRQDLIRLKELKEKGEECEYVYIQKSKRKGVAFKMKPRVAFVCVGNSCRSQMAEGFARHYGKDLIEIYSAGTDIAKEVNPLAITVMKEVGIDISSHFPKTIFDIPKEVDFLITMGCGVECPFIPCKVKEDWGLPDPAGKPIEEFRKVRDEIEKKVLELIERIKEEYYGERK